MNQGHSRIGYRRLGILLAALAAAGTYLAYDFASSQRGVSLPLYDFVEYWAAGRLLIEGDNPYDEERMLALERSVGRDMEAILMWNPPWTLPIVLPFAAAAISTAHLVWLAVQLAITLYSVDALWRDHGGPVEDRWVSWLIACTFLPTFFSLTVGQISPVILLGLVLFARFERNGWLALAGTATYAWAIKPHLVYLVWLGLGLWIIERRKWRVTVAGAIILIATSLIPLLFNPWIWQQYLYTITHTPPKHYYSPTIGTALRWLFGRDLFWLQFVPMAPGVAWFCWYWRQHRRGWNWTLQLRWLLLASLVTAVYGAWMFDMVLLLFPIIPAAVCAWQNRQGFGARAAIAYAAINLAGVAQLWAGISYFWFIWVSPAVLGLVWWVDRCAQRRAAAH